MGAGGKKKVSLSGSHSSSSQELLLSISWGMARAVGATTTHARPGHPALAHLSSQQRGKSPCTEQGLCGLLSMADPALPRDLLAFQFLLEKTSESRPLSPSPSPALPVKPPVWRRRHVRGLASPEVAARQKASWGSPFMGGGEDSTTPFPGAWTCHSSTQQPCKRAEGSRFSQRGDTWAL